MNTFQSSKEDNTQTDYQLIRNLKQEKSEDVLALWEMVFTYGVSITRRYDQDADIGHEAAIAAFQRIQNRGIHQFRFQCPFPAYCRQIVVNEVKRRLNKLPPPSVELTDEIHEDINADADETLAPDDSQAENHLVQKRLESCIDKLPSRRKDIVRKRYFEGKTPQSVAEELGLRRNHVNQILHRARQKLRECLEQLGFFTAGDVLGL